ncbi:MAG: alpha-amylase family glycosyl hydrolase [Planctomycetota bacterium]
MSKWPKYPLLYEINTRVWLNELSIRAGRVITLDKVPDEEIDRIARYGFHAVWLMGVWTTGSEPVEIARSHSVLQSEYRQALPNFTREDVVGSPYAVSAYNVSSHLGGPDALAVFRERLARRGIRLMLDFIFNHTACDHRFVTEHPEIYIQGSVEDLTRDPTAFFKTSTGQILAHGRDPYFPPWTDSAQINYGRSVGREIMKTELLQVAKQCDGVRCDMAMLLLPEVIEQVWGKRLGDNWIRQSFCQEVIQECNAIYSNFLFLAESYWNLEWKLQEEGFDFTYDKILYDRLRQNDHNGTRQHLQAALKFQDHCARFIENHDEQRAVTVFGAARARGAAMIGYFTPGLKLFHNGQLEGRRIKIPVQLQRRPLENEDVETALFYEKILAILQDNIFQTGEFKVCEVHSAGWGDASNESLIALTWTSAPCAASVSSAQNRHRHLGYLIVVNLNPWRAYGHIPLSATLFETSKQYAFHDCLDGKRYERIGSELVSPGLYIALEAHQQHLFEIYTK